MRPTATAWDTALRVGSESVVCDLPVDAAFAQALCARADVVLESFRPGVAARLGIGPDDVPDDDGLLLDHGLRRRHDPSPPRRPRRQLPRMGGRPRGHGTRAPADPDRRSRRRRARCRDADPRRPPRARPHGDRPARRRLHDSRLARPGCASPRRRACASPPDRRPRVLPDLRDRGRAPRHRRRARAEVLPPSLRARRPPRPRRPAVRRGSGRARDRARRHLRLAPPRGVARPLRRRGRLRRPRLDARRGRRRVRLRRHARRGAASARTRTRGGRS